MTSKASSNVWQIYYRYLVLNCALIHFGNDAAAVPPVCVYGEIDLEDQIQQLKQWMSTTHPNGRTDDWWLASYLAVSNFNIEDTEAHISGYYNFKKRYPKALQEREWFVSFLEGTNRDPSEEEIESNGRIVEMLDNGIFIVLFNTPRDGDSIVIVRFDAVPEDRPYKDVITVLTMYWDSGFSLLSPFLEQSAIDWSKLVCQGQTVPFSSTTDKCKNSIGYGITKPNQGNITSILDQFEAGPQFFVDATKNSLHQFRAGVAAIFDTIGVPESRLDEFAETIISLLECFNVYPIHLNAFHVFNNNPGIPQKRLERAFHEPIQLNNTYSLNIQENLAKIYLHGGDFGILSKCGIPQKDLPR